MLVGNVVFVGGVLLLLDAVVLFAPPAALFAPPAVLFGTPAALFGTPAALFGTPAALFGTLALLFSRGFLKNRISKLRILKLSAFNVFIDVFIRSICLKLSLYIPFNILISNKSSLLIV